MKLKKQYGISTQIEHIDIKDILKNYKKTKYWKKSWCVFKTNNFKFTFKLNQIDVKNNKIYAEVNYENANIVRGNRHFSFEAYYWDYALITIPIDNPDYKQEAFERALIGAITNRIDYLERRVIENTSDYKQAERSKDNYYDRVVELAKQNLDEEGVSNADIREAYIDQCRSNASCNYTTEVIYAKLKTIFPNLYLMLYSWFGKEENYKKVKEEILKKQASLKAKLIGIKREQWIQNDKIESDEIDDEIIDEILEEI